MKTLYKTFSRKDNVEQLLKTKLLIRQFIKCKTKTTFFCLRTHASFTGGIFYKFFSSRTKTWPKQPTCVASIKMLRLTGIQFVQNCLSVFHLPLKLKETSLFTNIVFVIQIAAGH